MTRKEFQKLIQSGFVFLDGATGSNLQKRGMPAGVCPELWVTRHPRILQELQEEFIAAGSDIVYAPTFGGNRIKLESYGLDTRVEEINTELVRISREAAAGRALVAGDLTMTGEQLEPLGELTFEELYDVYREQAAILAAAGVDLIIVETMMSLQETRVAVMAAREACPDLPVMATMSFTESGFTLYGASAESAVAVLQGLGVDAVGLNCSAGPDKMLDVLKRMAAVAEIPLIAKPNAGLPRMNEAGETVYDMEAEEFAVCMREMADAGAAILGGCCGTTPAHIARMRELVTESRGRNAAALKEADVSKKQENLSADSQKQMTGSENQSAVSENPAAPQDPAAVSQERNAASENPAAVSRQASDGNGTVLLADERKVYPFADGQELALGEGIDFTKDADLLEDWQEGCYDTAMDTAFDLQDDEADALLFCADGLAEEADILRETAAEVTQVVRLPVVIATGNPEAADLVLSRYPGIAAVLNTSPDSAVADRMREVLCRYGAPAVTIDKKIGYC